MTEIPSWIEEWILKDRLVGNKFKLSKKYIRSSKRVRFVDGEKDEDRWKAFYYVVQSKKHGRYNVRFENGRYTCNCPFFKHRLICSHILAVCQTTEVLPDRSTIFL